MTTAVIDRFEDDKAVLLLGEDEKKVVFPVSELPEGAEEGDYLKIKITYDAEATAAAAEEAARLLKELEEEN